ncbi:MAG: hypothetical protein NPIRA02_02410 [Nitrospirales bacterium]|nr:MAG: hypothetical protein NPIRA02_02410 [Nitrospirales bacterium]
MSHLTTIKSQIKFPDAILHAAQVLGVSVVQRAKARFYSGYSEPCDYVLQLPGRYDLGLKLMPDGTFHFVCDEEVLSDTENIRNGDALRILGKRGGRFLQEYQAAVALKQARKAGLTYHRTSLSDGTLQIRLTGRS